MAGVSGTGLALATIGGLLVAGGLTNRSPLAVLKGIASGANPNAPSSTGLISPSESAAIAAVGANLTALPGNNRSATAAQKSLGVPYKWGGADPSGWDCSGFVTWVLHHDVGLNLPSNTHTVTGQFMVWSGAQTIPTAQAEAGDLVCWLTHIAIAIDNTTCIGAENPSAGTTEGTFQQMGPGGETFIIRRVKPQ